MLIIYALDLDLLALVLSLPDLLLGFVGLNGQPIDGISYLLFFFFWSLFSYSLGSIAFFLSNPVSVAKANMASNATPSITLAP